MKFLRQFLLVFIAFAAAVEIVNSKPFDSDRIVFEDGENLGASDSLTAYEVPETNKAEENVDTGLVSDHLFQGDIILQSDQQEYFKSVDNNLPTRTGLLLEEYRWPKNSNGEVVVPYVIQRSDYTSSQATAIRSAMNGIEQHTCIRFVSRNSQADYIKIRSAGGCHSNLGKIGNEQEVSLASNGCMRVGTIQHELIHALGYDHMHNHIDRDKFISIKWNNIQPSTRHNFEKVNPRFFGNFGTSYDLLSVMHYHPTAFSKNSQATIVPKDLRYQKYIGQRTGMSPGDIKRINNMYKCFEENIHENIEAYIIEV